jgi:hypothetical protein
VLYVLLNIRAKSLSVEDLLDELEASRASRKSVGENLQEIRWLLKETVALELPAPARKVIPKTRGKYREFDRLQTPVINGNVITKPITSASYRAIRAFPPACESALEGHLRRPRMNVFETRVRFRR